MRLLTAIDALEDARLLDPVADVLGRVSDTVTRPRTLRAALEGRPLGHAVHPMLVQLPIGAWVSAGWLDFLPRTETAASVLTGVGLATALPAAAAGLADYRHLDARARRVAVVHVTANTVSLLCQAVSLRERLSGRVRRGQWIGLAGTMTLAVGGLLGGQLAHRLAGTATNR